MYAGVGSNVCVTNVGHTMFARVGDVYCVARGSSRSAARNPQLLKTKEDMIYARWRHRWRGHMEITIERGAIL